MSNNPFPIQDPALSYDAQDFRRLLSSLFGEGIADVTGGQLRVTPHATGSDMSVDVAGGLVYVQGDTIAGQGIYQAPFDALNLTIAAAPASGSRIDLVVARVYDKQVAGGATSGRAVEVLTGTAAAAPTAPKVPDTAVVLAQVTVAAGTTTITSGLIADLRSAVSSGSGAVGVQGQPMTAAQIAALTTPQKYQGRLIFNTTLGKLQQVAAPGAAPSDIGATKAQGTYLGDGAASRAITVGFTPDLVLISSNGAGVMAWLHRTETAAYQALYNGQFNAAGPGLTSTGFQVGDNRLNANTFTHYWTAWKFA